jgi:GTP:adenosylcobinamide-phosphate guanylyltransferase
MDSRARLPMRTGQLESINNKVKVIKRMADGYRDRDNFFSSRRSKSPSLVVRQDLFCAKPTVSARRFDASNGP